MALVGVEIECLWIDVHEYRLGVHEQYRGPGSDEGERCSNNLVAALDTKSEEGQMKPGGPIGDRYRMFRTAVSGEILLELFNFRSLD